MKRLSEFYHVPVEEFNKFQYDSIHAEKLRALKVTELISDSQSNHTLFAERDLNEFEEAEEAYHQLIIDLVTKQFMSTRLVQRGKKVKSIFVDGGFSKNSLYMHLMATVFPETEVYAASVAQASALGAALAIHQYWNKKSLPSDLIELKYYPDPTKQHDH